MHFLYVNESIMGKRSEPFENPESARVYAKSLGIEDKVEIVKGVPISEETNPEFGRGFVLMIDSDSQETFVAYRPKLPEIEAVARSYEGKATRIERLVLDN